MNEKTLQIYKYIKSIIDPVYIVGGSIRNILLGLEAKDYDFCTPLHPDEVEIKIRNNKKRPYLIGKKFGTIGMTIEGQMVEITTFRTEKYETLNRKPQVKFIKDITADLSRRDFSMNAIAWRNGKIIDPFNGRLDILEKKIRSVGKPAQRIKEDPLRMLRAGRFMSQLNFDIDGYLKCTIKKKSYKILYISKERWCDELDKILLSDYPSKGLQFIADTRLLNFILPEMSLQIDYGQNSPHHDYSLWEHTLKVVENTPKDIHLRWAGFLHDIAKPFVKTDKKDRSNYIHHDYLGSEIVEKYSRYLKWSNKKRDKIKDLVFNHLNPNCELKKYDDMSKLKEVTP